MATKNFRVRNGIEVGPATGSTNNVTIDGATGNIVTVGDIAVNGGDVTTTSTTANLFNATATTVNIAGAATTANIGFSSPTSSTTYTNNIINGTAYSRLYNTTNNSIVYPLNLSAVAGTGITPTIGYGVGVKAQSTLTDGSLGEIGKFEFESTAILSGDNDSVFKIYTYENGLEYKNICEPIPLEEMPTVILFKNKCFKIFPEGVSKISILPNKSSPSQYNF